MAEKVLAGGRDIGAPVERNVVVIVSDIRGYTALTEGLDPRLLVEQVLNRCYGDDRGDVPVWRDDR